MHPQLSAVIVNYNTWPDTRRLVRQLCQAGLAGDPSSEIVVVDNAYLPHPDETDWPAADRVRLLRSSQNTGFAGGVNRGCRAARGRFLLVMNPDLEVRPGFLADLHAAVERMQAAPLQYRGARRPVGMVGFQLLNPDRSRQHCAGFFPQVWWTIAGQLFARDRRKYRPLYNLRLAPVDWVTGACFLLDRRLFDQLGGMDERFFLYYEEVDFCRRAQAAGWQVAYDPAVRLVHYRPLQSRNVGLKLRMVTRHSQLYYFRKHLPRWQFALLAVATAAEAQARSWSARLAGAGRDRCADWLRIRSMACRMLTGPILPVGEYFDEPRSRPAPTTRHAPPDTHPGDVLLSPHPHHFTAAQPTPSMHVAASQHG